MELDPFSVIVNWNAIGTLVLGHRYDEALAQARHTLEISPDAELVNGSFLRIYENQGDYEKALDLRDKFLPERFGGSKLSTEMRRMYTQSGPRGYWQAVLNFMLSMNHGNVAESKAMDVGLAYAYAHLGDRERALAHLESAYASRSGDMLYLKVEPSFDPLHDDPRFQALVRRVGIP